MRERISRAKRIDNGEWVEGFYVCVPEHYKPEMSGKSYIVSINNGLFMEVVPETVGDYTGLTDDNSKRIFEGDIVKTWKNNTGKIEFGQYWDEEIEADFYGYAWIGKDEYGDSIILSLNKCWNGHEVIGNIHDNPELLEVEK